MNIFWLHKNFKKLAQAYSEEHIAKIALEICQCLFAVLHKMEKRSGDSNWRSSFSKVYKVTHKNHPVTLWMGQCPSNFLCGIEVGLALCEEYTVRRGKEHACQKLLAVMYEFASDVNLAEPYKETTVLATVNLPMGVTPVPLCMPKKFMVLTEAGFDLTSSYRMYYAKTKMLFKHRACTYPKAPPSWCETEFFVAHAMDSMLKKLCPKKSRKRKSKKYTQEGIAPVKLRFA